MTVFISLMATPPRSLVFLAHHGRRGLSRCVSPRRRARRYLANALSREFRTLTSASAPETAARARARRTSASSNWRFKWAISSRVGSAPNGRGPDKDWGERTSEEECMCSGRCDAACLVVGSLGGAPRVAGCSSTNKINTVGFARTRPYRKCGRWPKQVAEPGHSPVEPPAYAVVLPRGTDTPDLPDTVWQI